METRKGRETDPKLSLSHVQRNSYLSLLTSRSPDRNPMGQVYCLHSTDEEAEAERKNACPKVTRYQRESWDHHQSPRASKVHSSPTPISRVNGNAPKRVLWSSATPPPPLPSQFYSKMSVDPLVSWREEGFLPQLLHSPIWRVLPVPLSSFTIQLSVTENDATYVVHLVYVGTH